MCICVRQWLLLHQYFLCQQVIVSVSISDVNPSLAIYEDVMYTVHYGQSLYFLVKHDEFEALVNNTGYGA